MDIFDLLFPKSCLSCKRQGRYICDKCLARVTSANPICPACKRFSLNGKTHSYCKNKTSLDGLIVIWRYEGIIRTAITRIKYNFNFDIAAELAMLASLGIKNLEFISIACKGFAFIMKNSLLTPIPIYKSRERWRGFNQADLMAKMLARNLNLEYRDDFLIRIKQTIPQAKLGREERLRSIRGVFAENPSDSSKRIVQSAKKIIMVDDVYTTGATMDEAAKVLKKAGAKEVWGLAMAR